MHHSTLNQPKTASYALWGGLIFSVLFTALIALLDFRLDAIEATINPDQGGGYYFWQLATPTWITQTSVWLLYALHQIAFWGLIYYAQTRVGKYTQGLHRVDVWALGMNALFIVLHLIQTHVFYDGTAQDVSIWSSQFSVILMLVFILMMENQRRGLFFGKKVPLNKQVIDWLRHYHGYIFAWALVYTFWYHPMVNTVGHLVGFFYMFCLMLQGSLFLTRIHVNRNWTFVQEILVLFHGTSVALTSIEQGGTLWHIFFFGFMGILVITQLYGLKMPQWVRVVAFVAWVAGVTTVVIQAGRLPYLFPVLGIPLIEYGLVFGLTALMWLGAWIVNRFNRTQTPSTPRIGSVAESGD
jgi:hypothetical protein